jgi:crotonobetainyl-CoA:carnitine CoA-transferase CaiB-like acyl-CoA transferase
MDSHISNVTAFRFPGRLSESVATPSSMATATSGGGVAGTSGSDHVGCELVVVFTNGSDDGRSDRVRSWVHRSVQVVRPPGRAVTTAGLAPGPTGPLTGIRVIDATQALSGPFCTMLLADLGADVIKIEPPGGDMTRFSGPFTSEDTERAYGGYFASINRNKRSVVLDLKTDSGRDALLRLADRADAFVENSKAGVMDRLGVGYDTLRERNPRLVYAAIRGFGDPRTGASPYVGWPAFDVVAQAMGGAVGITGTLAGEKFRCGASIGDIYPATLAAVGINAALVHAARTGEGQFLDVAMYDGVLALCETIVYRYSYTGQVPRPTGNGHPVVSPFDLFPTSDGSCAIAAPTDKHWARLCDIIGRPGLAGDDCTRTNSERVANASFVREAISAWTAARTTQEVVAALGGQVAVGPVQTAGDIFGDPHVAARRMLVEVPQPDGSRPVVLAGPPIKLTATPAGVYRRPPRLGEHTDEVLAEVGLCGPSTRPS